MDGYILLFILCCIVIYINLKKKDTQLLNCKNKENKRRWCKHDNKKNQF